MGFFDQTDIFIKMVNVLSARTKNLDRLFPGQSKGKSEPEMDDNDN